MSDKSSSSSAGIGFCGLLAIVFIVLKLIGEHFHTPVADWSWWWVLSPLWIPVAIVFAVIGVVAVIAIIRAGLK